MKQIDFVYRTILAELAQRVTAAPSSAFDVEGRFVPVAVKGRRYWYFDHRGAGGGKVRKYVGPDDDETTQTVAQFRALKDDARARRKMVRMLTREADLPAPDPLAGKIIRSLAEAGLFRRDCVLIERHAYACFTICLGMQLPQALWERTQTGICLCLHAAADIATVRDVLRSTDRSFAATSFSAARQGDVRFANEDGFWIELAAPTLLGAYLVEEPAKAVMLYNCGIEVTVPRPERYAIHELMMSARADADDGILVREYFRRRALVMMQALLGVGRQADLAEAFEAAWSRNDTWKELIERGMTLIDDMHLRSRILEGLTQGMQDIGHDPAHVH